MRLCQSCSLREAGCLEICADVKEFLKGKKNYRTTFHKKEVSLNEIHENRICESLGDYLDSSGSFTEKFGYLLPAMEKIVHEHGTDRQKQIYFMWVSEKMSFSCIAKQLHMKVQSVHEVVYGHRGQGGLVRKIRKHLAKLPEVSFIS